MALERSGRGLQLRFRHHCDRTLQSGVMAVQSSSSPAVTLSGLHFGSPRNLCHLDVVSTASCNSIGLLLSPGRGESCVSKRPWLVPTPKGVPNAKLTSHG
jgi:hypothetical protein